MAFINSLPDAPSRVFALCLAVAVTAGYLVFLHYETRATIAHQLAVYEETFRAGLELRLWNLEQREMDAFTQGMLNLPYVVGIAVAQAETGGLFSTAGVYPGNRADTASLIAHRFEFRRRDSNGGITGTATLYSDSALIWQAVQMDYLLVIGSAATKTLALRIIFL